jgi:uncharacterized protein
MSVLLLAAKVVLGLVVAAYLASGLYLYLNQARFLFPGAYMSLPRGFEDAGRAMGLEPATINVRDGTALFAVHRAPKPGQPVIIVFHGNGSYPEDYGFLYEDWIASGHGVVAPVARGYPRSAGHADGEAMLGDALDINDWAIRTYPGHPVIVFGQSLGTAPAIHIAARRDVAGVILVSPFASMLSLVREKIPYLPIALLLKSPFRSDLEIAEVSAPILIFHGDRDTLVPIASGRELAALARREVLFETISGAGHNDGLFGSVMIRDIAEFIARAATLPLK